MFVFEHRWKVQRPLQQFLGGLMPFKLRSSARRSVSLVLAATVVAPAMPLLAQNASSDTELEEVIVTAQKREQRLQDVPVSITALSADQLVALKLNSGTDLQKYTPNLRISNAGNEDQPKISI